MANILIVDDDHIVRKVVRGILAKAGHIVLLANDGRQALELLELQAIDLIVSDANMPGGVSGFNLVAMIRANPSYKNIPIIFLTSRKDKSDIIRAVQSGANDYVIKPVRPDVFLKKVETSLQLLVKRKSNAG